MAKMLTIGILSIAILVLSLSFISAEPWNDYDWYDQQYAKYVGNNDVSYEKTTTSKVTYNDGNYQKETSEKIVYNKDDDYDHYDRYDRRDRYSNDDSDFRIIHTNWDNNYADNDDVFAYKVNPSRYTCYDTSGRCYYYDYDYYGYPSSNWRYEWAYNNDYYAHGKNEHYMDDYYYDADYDWHLGIYNWRY